MIARLRSQVETAEGSTRLISLVRIGLALVCWARFADDFGLYRLFSGGRSWVWAALGASIYMSSTLLLIGWRSRFAALWTALTIAAIVLFLGVRERHFELVHHHVSLLMIVVGLLALCPCGGSFSVDRWRAVERARAAGEAPPAERGPLWGSWLIALQVSAVYLWGAIDKTHAGWLYGDRVQHIYMYFYAGSDTPQTALFEPLAMVAGIGTVALEYLLGIGLWIRRWHRWLLPAAILFHAAVYFTVPVATFTATLYVLYLTFLDPDRAHALIDRLLGAQDAPR